MRKILGLTVVVTAILIVSAMAVFAHTGWRGVRTQWDEEKVVTLEGTIKDTERPIITMDVEGKEYTLHVGPYWYWEEKGLKLEKDQKVTVTGMVEEYEDVPHVYPKTIKINDETVELTDKDGVPVWAGQRGGRGPRFGKGCGDCDYGQGRGWQGHGRMHSRGGYRMGGGRGGRGYRGCGR